MARVTAYAESLGRVSKTTSGFTDVVSLTHTPSDNKTVAYLWSAVADCNDITSDVQIRFNRDTDAVVDAAQNFEAKEGSTPVDAFPCGGIVIVSYGASPGSKTVSIEYAAESPSTVGVQYARIVAIELGANDASASGTSVDDTSTSTTFADVTSASASLTPSTTGDYLIIGSIEMKHSVGTSAWAARMVIDAVNKTSYINGPKDATNYVPGFHLEKVNLASGASRVAKWQFAINSAGTTSARRGRVLMLRLDDFANSYYGEARTLTGGTDTTYQTKLSLNPTIAQNVEHIVIGAWNKRASSGAVSSYSKFDDASVLSENLNEATLADNDYPALVAYRATLASGAGVTWTVQRKSETTGATTSVGEAAIAILQTADSAAAASPFPPWPQTLYQPTHIVR